MPTLNNAASTLIQNTFYAALSAIDSGQKDSNGNAINEYQLLLDLITSSQILTEQLNIFAQGISGSNPVLPGAITFNQGTGGDFVLNYGGTPTINLNVALPSSGSVVPVTKTDPFNTSKISFADSIAGVIAGTLAHELGHFENSPDNLSPNLNPYTEMPSANPYYLTGLTAINQAQLVADALLGEGNAEYNNIQIANQVAAANNSAELISFALSQNAALNTAFEQQGVNPSYSISTDVRELAAETAVISPSTALGEDYLAYYWLGNDPSVPGIIRLSEQFTDVKNLLNSSGYPTVFGVQINADAITGLASEMILHHANSDGTAYIYDSDITFGNVDPTHSQSVTDTWKNSANTNSIMAVQTITGSDPNALVYTDIIYQDNYAVTNAPTMNIADGANALQYSVGADGSQGLILSDTVGTSYVIKYAAQNFAGDQAKITVTSNGVFVVDTIIGNGDSVEVASVFSTERETQDFIFSGAAGSLTLDASAQGAAANNYVIDAASTASSNVTTDTINFGGHSIAGNVNVGTGVADQYGRTYAYDNGTLTITSGYDTLTINDFENGDFGVKLGYKIAKLTDPGSSNDFANALGINDSGVIVGGASFATANGGMAAAFVGTGTVMGNPYGLNSYYYADAISNNGQIIVDDHNGRYYLDNHGAISYISQQINFSPSGINNSGTIVGVGGGLDSYIDTNGVLTAYHISGTVYTRLYGINDKGVLVGYYTDSNYTMHGFIDNGGSLTIVNDPLAGANGTVVTAINNEGVVVGYYEDSAGHDHGFVDNNGTFFTVDAPGVLNTRLHGINDEGVVVGSADQVYAFSATPLLKSVQSVAENNTAVSLDDGITTEVIGNNNILSGGNSNFISISGNNNSFTGVNGSTINVASPQITASIVGDTNTVALTDSDTITLSGSNNTISAAGDNVTVSDDASSSTNSFNLSGNNYIASLQGAADTVTLSGTGAVVNVANASIKVMNSVSASIAGSHNSITLSSQNALILTGSGDTINTRRGSDLTTDTLTFDGAAVSGNAVSGSINTLGNSYVLNGSTLTVTHGSDTLTVNNFVNGDFGLNVSTVAPYTISTFGAPGYARTLVNGINAGEILGRTANGGYRDASGNFTYIPGTNTSLVGGNNNGVYVGFSFDASGYYHGLLDNNGTISTVDYPAASYTVLQSVNDSGEIVGWTIGTADNENHGLIDIGGMLTRYDIAGAAWTVINGVNNKGVITGTFGLTDNDAEGFIDDHGAITILDFPGTTHVTLADALNDEGQVVGTFTDAAGATHSFVYQNGVYTQIDVPVADGTTTIANGINDAGQIVGEYTNSSTGKLSGFIANPTGVNLVNGTGASLTVTASITETISGNGNTISVDNNDVVSLFGNDNIISGVLGSDLTTDVLSFDGNLLSGAVITNGTDSYGNSYVLSGATLTITSGTGEVLTVADFVNGDFGITLGSSGPVTYNESNSSITVADDVNAVVTGSSNTITVGNGDTLSVSGYNNGVTVSGSGSTVADDAVSSQTVYNVTGNSDNVTLAGYGDTATITGSGETIDVTGTSVSISESGSGGNSITLAGDSDTATIAGSNDILTLSGYADAAVINGAGNETVHLTGTNDSLTETGSGSNHITLGGDSETAVLGGSNSVITLSGYADVATITGAGGETVTLTGTNDSLIETGTGNNIITLGGDSQVATIGGSNSTLALSGYADALTISNAGNETVHLTGTNDSLNETGSGSNTITLTGDSETATIGGSNSTITLSGYADSVTINGAGNEIITLNGTNESLTEAGYGSNAITLGGDTDTATIGGGNSSITLSGYNDSAIITGSNETIILSGTNASVTLSGQNDVVTASSGTTVTIAAGDTVVINGSGVTVTGGAAARATINHTDGTSAIEVFNQSATVLSNTKNYSGANGTGTLTSQVVDYVAGNSRENLFTGLAAGVSELDLFYSGLDMTGTLAKEITDYTAGNSVLEVFNPSANVLSTTKYYSGLDASGTLTSDTIDLADGTSKQERFTGLATGVTEEVDFYSGADLTGTLTKQLFDYATGSSTLERFNPTSTVLSTTKNYSGLDASGTLTSQVNDYTDGTSREWLYSNLPSGVSQETLFYSGADLSGSLTKEITDYTNGTSTVEMFNSSFTILTNTKYYTGLDGAGTLTSQTIDYTDGTSRQVLYTNLPAGVSEEDVNYSGADLSGTVTSTLLQGSAGNDTITATATKQTLIGNGGYDTYQFGRGDGQDTIRNGLSTNTGPTGELDLGAGIASNQIWFEQKGNNLQVDILGTTDHITIAGWYSNAYSQLSEIKAGSSEIDSQLASLVQAMATYTTNHHGFNPTTATTMPTDTTLQNALAAAWHG